MSENNGQSNPTPLDAFLDRRLDPAVRRAFETRLATDDALRQSVSQQREIDGSLVRLFTPATGAADEVMAAVATQLVAMPASKSDVAPDATPAPVSTPSVVPMPVGGAKSSTSLLRALWSWRQPFAAAAVLAIAVSAGLYSWRATGHTGPRHPRKVKPVGIDSVYRDFASRDPNSWCDDDQDFASAIYIQTGTGLLLPATLPPTVKVNGFRRCQCFSTQSLVLMMKVEDQQVLVMIDRLANEKEQTLPADSKLKVFRKVVDTAVLHEITPFDAPRVLDLFYDPQMPKDWYRRGW